MELRPARNRYAALYSAAMQDLTPRDHPMVKTAFPAADGSVRGAEIRHCE